MRPGRRVLLIGIGSVLFLAALATFLVRREPARQDRGAVTSPAPPERARTNLTLIEGRLFEPGRTNPFQGWILDHYPDGTLLSRSEVSNGVLHGLSQGWHTNGTLQIEEHFKNGKSDGLRRKYHANGSLLSEAAIQDARIVGVFRRWYENGQLAEEITMSNGTPHGESRSWYPDGRAKARALVEDGKVTEHESW